MLQGQGGQVRVHHQRPMRLGRRQQVLQNFPVTIPRIQDRDSGLLEPFRDDSRRFFRRERVRKGTGIGADPPP